MAGDAYFGLVSSSLHGNGANNGTVITDSALSPKTWTRITSGFAETRTAQKKFGTASLYFESTGGTVGLSTPNTASLNFTGDFTVDGWFYTFDTNTRAIFNMASSDDSNGSLALLSSG